MSQEPGTNWQLMFADLCIILFLATFSALSTSESRAAAAAKAKPPVLAAQATPNAAPAPEAIAEPVGVWRAGEGAPPLGEWLKQQAADPRMRVNVYGSYSDRSREAVLREATSVAADPALLGHAVRLILEPAEIDAVTVTLSYDRG